MNFRYRSKCSRQKLLAITSQERIHKKGLWIQNRDEKTKCEGKFEVYKNIIVIVKSDLVILNVIIRIFVLYLKM